MTDELEHLKSEMGPEVASPADAQERAERSLLILRSLKTEAQRTINKINQSFRQTYDDLWYMEEGTLTPEDLSLYAFSKNFLRDAECELDDHLQLRLSVASEELESLIPQKNGHYIIESSSHNNGVKSQTQEKTAVKKEERGK